MERKNIDFSELRKSLIRDTKKKISKSVTRDQLIIQTINHIEDLHKVCSSLATRLREWYELQNPEFSHSIVDNEKFVELILKENPVSEMGANLEEKDLKPMMDFAKELEKLYALKGTQEKYLESLMKLEAPNLSSVAGNNLGAKLIVFAGSLKHLSEMTAPTIQLLGAERALFRHLKNKKQRPPKYGILHEHDLVARAKKEDKGKIARTLASKISIAVKIDFFKGKFAGDKLKKEIEEKIAK